MADVWDRMFDQFSVGDHDRAESSFRLYTRLEEITDTEYEEKCYCGSPGCTCRD